MASFILKTLLRWEADNSGCGNVVYHQSEGFIRSPGRPGNYQNNQNCKWTIYTEESSHIELTFTAFDLEGGSCIFDYVEIYDGDSEDFPVRVPNSTNPEHYLVPRALRRVSFEEVRK